jgi:hypothetical protein
VRPVGLALLSLLCLSAPTGAAEPIPLQPLLETKKKKVKRE